MTRNEFNALRSDGRHPCPDCGTRMTHPRPGCDCRVPGRDYHVNGNHHTCPPEEAD